MKEDVEMINMKQDVEIVEQKVAEAEFFLRKMSEVHTNFDEFRWYFSAFLTASRTVQDTFRNNYNHLKDFNRWIRSHKKTLETGSFAKFFRSLRNTNTHGEGYSICGTVFSNVGCIYYFDGDSSEEEKLNTSRGVLAVSRQYFIDLLETTYDAFVFFGPQIDDQQFFTKEYFATMNKDIVSAECMVWGFERTSLADEGYSDDDRWFELRSRVSKCEINHLFYSYLNKVTPQPILPDYLEEIEDSPVDKGWEHIPAGFSSLEEYRTVSHT